MQAGATLHAREVHITDVAVAGLEVMGEKSHLTCTKCNVIQFSPHYMHALQVVRGIRVLNRATAELTNCFVHGAQWGIDIYSSHKVDLCGIAPTENEENATEMSSVGVTESTEDGPMSNTYSHLLDNALGEGFDGTAESIARTTKATCTSCDVTACELQALRVEGGLTDAVAHDSNLSHSGKGGVVVLNGGKLTAHDCKTWQNKDAGTMLSTFQ